MNEEVGKKLIKNAYRTIRIVKEIQRGNRTPLIIAEKANAPLNLVHYYLKYLMKGEHE